VSFYWVCSSVVGFALTVLGFWMLGWKELRATWVGGPYLAFGAMTLVFASHLGPVSRPWSVLFYALGVCTLAFGLCVLAFSRRLRGWFIVRYALAGIFWLVLAVAIPEVTSSMRMFPVLIGLSYLGIAIATQRAQRLDGSHVGPDLALNGMGFLFLGILLASVPDFFTHVGTAL
jgi:hypothetical protein